MIIAKRPRRYGHMLCDDQGSKTYMLRSISFFALQLQCEASDLSISTARRLGHHPMDEVERMADRVTEYLPRKLAAHGCSKPCDAWSIRRVFDRESASGPDVKHRSHRPVPCGDGTAARLSSGPPKPTLERNIHRIGPCSRPVRGVRRPTNLSYCRP